MEILNLRPTNDTGQRIRQIAVFDLQLTPGCRLFGLRLMEAPDGNRFVYGPQARGHRAATFAVDLAIEITERAVTAYEKNQFAAWAARQRQRAYRHTIK
jgi:hypothetical protein